MAPRTTGSRRTQAQTDRLFELGVQGRKTGVTLRDTGVRDEHGMQPLEDIFSSPEKTARIDTNHAADDDESGDSSGQEMDIENTTAPDPAILMRAHGNTLKVPLPRSRSPIKTYLQSPARQNPHLNPNSSPVRGSIVGPNEPARAQSVKRRLDFSLDVTSHSLSQPTTSSSGGRAAAEVRPRANGLRNRRSLQDEDEDGADEETILHGEQQEDDSREPEESMAMINDGGDDASDPGYENEYYDNDGGDVELGEESRNDEEVVEAEAKSSRRKSQRGGVTRNTVPDVSEEEEEEEPVRRKRGRPAKNKSIEAQQRGSTKRRRSSITAEEEAELEHEPEPEPEPEPERKKQRTGGKPRGRKPAGKTATNTDKTGEPSKQTTKPATKGKRGRPRRSSIDAADRSLAVVPRGPPLPKARGLLISRREVPGDGGITRTRSGRNSFRPLAFWRNEHVDYDQDQTMDDAFASRGNPSKFVLPTIKEVHRVEEAEPEAAPKRRGRPAKAGGAGAKRRQGKAGGGADMFDEPAEAWEEDPGTVVGDAVVWQPEYEYAPPGLDEEIELAPEQLAVSGQAIETRDIRNASFRFAKTLSMPFFGAGVVDLPPGSEKRPKNSRKMYMAFFVFAGRVLVTVNESTFRIGRGGMWFVPRGNIYSIENDYDEPARVFFSQGCEPIQQPVEDEDGAE